MSASLDATRTSLEVFTEGRDNISKTTHTSLHSAREIMLARQGEVAKIALLIGMINDNIQEKEEYLGLLPPDHVMRLGLDTKIQEQRALKFQYTNEMRCLEQEIMVIGDELKSVDSFGDTNNVAGHKDATDLPTAINVPRVLATGLKSGGITNNEAIAGVPEASDPVVAVAPGMAEDNNEIKSVPGTSTAPFVPLKVEDELLD